MPKKKRKQTEKPIRLTDELGNLLRHVTRCEIDMMLSKGAPIKEITRFLYREKPQVKPSDSRDTAPCLNQSDMNLLAGRHFAEGQLNQRAYERLSGWAS